ncbi:MAG: hypothetical protein CM15mP36_11150 [Flavobacteriales bacterium]|nr:MAG: hypothetical protein CM15mP36_11150 [Flavobacteriales bacterium]
MSSVKKTWLNLLNSSEKKYSDKLKSILFKIEIIDIITAKIINKVCNVSVHTMVFIPPLNVYIQISAIEIPTVTGNGTFQLSKTNC